MRCMLSKFLNNLNILANLNILNIKVPPKNLIRTNYSKIIKIRDAAIIMKSNIFYPNLKYLEPSPINLIMISTENIAVKPISI